MPTSSLDAAKNGIQLFLAVGIHPMGTPDDWPKVVDALPSYLKMSEVIGLGEIGLHVNGAPLEIIDKV